MKLGLLAASLVLVAGAAVGCSDGGGGGGAEDAPTTDEFCGALGDFADTLGDVDPSKDLAGYVQTLKDEADKLDELGTPSNMPGDARAGFQLYVDKIKALPDDATEDDLANLGDVGDADQKKLDALQSYVEDTCPELGQQTESESP